MLPFRARVDLGAMAMKGWSTFPKVSASLEPHHQIVYYPSPEVQLVYSTAPADWANYLEKGRTINSKYYIELLVYLKEEIAKKTAINEEKSALSQRQCTVSSWSQQWQTYMNCILNCFRTHPILQGKRFGSNEEVISETEAYSEVKDKSFYKRGIELLEKCWNQRITLEGDYVDE